jgi:predicted PurR-regulated permease PerM
LTFIPYVGALVGGALSIGLALFQFWGEWWSIIAVAAGVSGRAAGRGQHPDAEAGGQFGGLHPVWLIFALSAFGALFGFVGMLVAVPVAAVIGVWCAMRWSGIARGGSTGGSRRLEVTDAGR